MQFIIGLKFHHNFSVKEFQKSTLSLSLFTTGPADKVEIKAAADEWNKYTCLNVREATKADVNRVRLQNGKG